MASDAQPGPPRVLRNPLLRALLRKDALAGLMFIVIGGSGLWLSRSLTVGTLRRMGAGFMPQVLCWLLIGLGAVVLAQGLLARDKPSLIEEIAGASSADSENPQSFWPILIVAASLVAFALTIEPFGLVVSVFSLVLIASFAYRGLGWLETLATAVIMSGLCWAVFVLGLGMSSKVFPELW